MSVALHVCLSPLPLDLSNFKVKVLVNTESTQFFVWLRVCLLYVVNHVVNYVVDHVVLSLLLMSNSGATSTWNYDGFQILNRLKFFCVSPLRGRQCGQPQHQSQITMITFIVDKAVRKKTLTPWFSRVVEDFDPT